MYYDLKKLLRLMILMALMLIVVDVFADAKDADKLVLPQVEVCFVLDTTGSMSGLIDGAKQKIWYIANEMMRAEPAPEIKFCLIGYRDKGDEYVTKRFDLTTDIDFIYQQLMAFVADGGGDTPEAVNQALYEAVNDISWSIDNSVLKIIYLIGDAPPHEDYAGEVQYDQIAELARLKDIIINPIQCGDSSITTAIWGKISKIASGSFAAIAQSGNVSVINTPMDQDFVALNVKIGQTIVPYGSSVKRDSLLAKQKLSEKAEKSVSADRLSFNLKTNKVIQGGGDLIDDLQAGSIKLEDIDNASLPAAMQTMDLEQRRHYIQQKSAERKLYQEVIQRLALQRDQFIRSAQAKQDNDGNGDSFDAEVIQALRRQATRKGIHYK